MTAAVIQAVKDWATFHINNFDVKEFNEHEDSGAFKLARSSSLRAVSKFLEHEGTGELYTFNRADKHIPDMKEIAKRNVLVGLGMGFSNWYFWGLGMKDAGMCLYHVAKSAQTIWKAYKREDLEKDFDRSHFINVEIPNSLHPAYHHGVHAVKNFAMAAVLEMALPTFLTYNFVLGGAAALYGVRNPLNFRTLFTRFENWWTADAQPIDQASVSELKKLEQVKLFANTQLKLHQILFPEPIKAVNNPVIGEEGERKYVAATPVDKKRD